MPVSHDNARPQTPNTAPSVLRRLVPLAIVFPLIGLPLSGIMTWANIGFTPDFLLRWMLSLASAVPVMLVAVFLLGGLAKIVGFLLSKRSSLVQKLVLAVLMALTMECLMTTVITMHNLGLSTGFSHAWVTAFINALPVGIVLGLLMSFVIKPRIDRFVAASPAARSQTSFPRTMPDSHPDRKTP